MKLGGRDVSTVARAVFERRHYVAAMNMLRTYERPFAMFGRYLLATGQYPATIRVHTPLATVDLMVFCRDDVLTVNEVFCREDYKAGVRDKIVVDFGSNIGISAAYFLSRSLESFVYLLEPLPTNIEKLGRNLHRFEGRYSLQEVAVGLDDGEVEFGWEETGRYGGVGLQTGKYIRVQSRNSNKVLDEVIGRHGQIDILKIDIETLEDAVIENIPREIARCIRKIYVEHRFDVNPLAETHDFKQYGSIARFSNRAAPSMG